MLVASRINEAVDKSIALQGAELIKKADSTHSDKKYAPDNIFWLCQGFINMLGDIQDGRTVHARANVIQKLILYKDIAELGNAEKLLKLKSGIDSSFDQAKKLYKDYLRLKNIQRHED